MKLSEKELSIINNPDKWEKVESSNIDAILFIPDGDRCRGRLFVRFKGNKLYFYEEVSKSDYKKMLKAESKGKFLNSNIIPNYQCYQVK